MVDPNQQDMQVYMDTPGLLDNKFDASSNPGQAAEAFSSSAEAAGQDFSFGDMGIDANTQLLEAILAELRTLNQSIRELT